MDIEKPAEPARFGINKLLALALLFGLAVLAVRFLEPHSFDNYMTAEVATGGVIAYWFIPAFITLFGPRTVSPLRFAIALVIGGLMVYFSWFHTHHGPLPGDPS